VLFENFAVRLGLA